MNKSRWIGPLIGLLLFSPVLLAAGTGTDSDGLPPRLAKMDSNQDGKLSADELRAAQDARIARLDANGDGEVTVEEFRAQREARRQARMQKMMDRMDTNGDGIVSTAELKEKGHDRLIKLDTDGDGTISADEMRKQRMGKRGHHGGHRHGRHHGEGDGAAGKGH